MNAIKLTRKSKDFKKYLGKRGKVLVVTKIFSAPEGHEYLTPYYSAIIQLENGEKITVQITDSKEIKSNQKIILCLRRGVKVDEKGVIDYTIKARPV